MDDFPNEFRPIVQWPGPNDIQLTLPPGVRYSSAAFSVYNRSGWAFAYPVNATQSGSTVTLQTWTTNGSPRNWPRLDKDGHSIDMMIRGSLINDCPATLDSPIGPATLSFPFIAGFYSTDPACRIVHPAPDTLPYPTAPPIDIALSSLVDPYHVTSTTTTITGIDFTYRLGWGNSSIENTWVRVTSGGLAVNAVHRAGNPTPILADANGYFRLGSIGLGQANAAHLSLDVTLTSCSPGVKIPVAIEYGYDCSGYPTAAPPSPGAGGCVVKSYTFDVLPEPSGMSMAVTPPAVNSGRPCDSYPYKVRITSTDLADVENPRLTITLPPGLAFATSPAPTFFRNDPSGTESGTLSTVSQIGQDFTWNINQDVYGNGGIPPTPAYVDLTFTLTGACGPNVGPMNPIMFRPLGNNLCGGNVTYPSVTEALHFSSALTVTNCPNDVVLECPAITAFGSPTFVDPCDPDLQVSFIDEVLPSNCPVQSAVKRTWTARNRCGQTVSCSQTITRRDTTAPTLENCTNVVVKAGPNDSGAVVTYAVVARDDCDPTPRLVCNPPSGSTFSFGVETVCCTATDACDNSNRCCFTVMVRPPGCFTIENEVFTCGSTNGIDGYRFCVVNQGNFPLGHLTLVDLPPGVSVSRYFLALNPPIPVGATGCVSVALSGAAVNSNLCFRLMAHSPDFDECCIVAHCTPVLALARDTTPPEIRCPDNIALGAESGQTRAVVTFNVTATDDSGDPVTLVCTPQSGSRFETGVTTVRCVATDACGNSNVCTFTVTVRGGKGDLYVEDTPYDYAGAPDSGIEPMDPAMATQSMWKSRGLWVHQTYPSAPGTYLSHQNPRVGQQNGVFVNVKNRGSGTFPAGAQLEVYYANASLGLSWPAGWTLFGTKALPAINAGASFIEEFPWSPPVPGHFCLVARIVSALDPITTTETTSINLNTRKNNNIAWRNVNVADCLRVPARKVEVRCRNTSPQPKRVTLVLTATEEFLRTGGEAVLEFGPLHTRWQAAGARGTNIAVTNGTQLRCTGSPARIEGIPLAGHEERILILTLAAREPMPMPGTNHLYHVALVQEEDGEEVGGVNYAVPTRAQATDTDGDGIPDVRDPDDDNDGIPDATDDSPLGEQDCDPSALTLTRDGQNIVLTWGGLGYQLQCTPAIGQPWVDVVGASSPATLPAPGLGTNRFYRLICR